MAAPVSQQGSRAGLITAVIVFVILFVTSTIFAIYFQAQMAQREKLLSEANSRTDQYVRPEAAGSTEVLELTSQAKKPEAAMDVVLQQRSMLSRDIAGSVLPAAKADVAARSALAYAADKLGSIQSAPAASGDAASQPAVAPAPVDKPAFTDLVSAIRSMADMVVAANGDTVKVRADAAASAKLVEVANADRDKARQQATADVEEANKKTAEAVAAGEQYRGAKDQEITTIQQTSTDTVKTIQTGTDKINIELTKSRADLAAAQKLIEQLTNRLKGRRINSVEAIVQQSDGHISRIPSANTVFIDIGRQQSVTPGLTFEVYDKTRGIPALGKGDREEDMPVGKASIEVVHVLDGSSECRVVRHALGQQLTEGDLIMNLVFDPKAKYNFVVYGNFDLNNSGTPNPADAEVVKRLVTQWGGKLMNGVTVDTDFVVMGKEPVVPILTKEDADDPAKVAEHDKKQKELDDYQELRSKAISLGVPLLNQNRFLYFVGYYDQATR